MQGTKPLVHSAKLAAPGRVLLSCRKGDRWGQPQTQQPRAGAERGRPAPWGSGPADDRLSPTLQKAKRTR